MHDFEMHRRRVLGCLGGLATGLLSGCLTAPLERTTSITMETVTIVNWDVAEHEFRVRLYRDEERIHESTHHIPGRRGGGEPEAATVTLDCTWEDRAGEHAASVWVDDEAWVDGPEWEHVDLSRGFDADGDYGWLDIRYARDDRPVFDFAILTGEEVLDEAPAGCSYR